MSQQKEVRYKGFLVNQHDLCQKHGISTQLLSYRMKSNPRVAVEHLLYLPISPTTYYMFNDMTTLSTKEICKKYNLKKATLQSRINRYYDGTNIEELLYPTGESPNLLKLRKKDTNTEIKEPNKVVKIRKTPSGKGKPLPDITHLEWNDDLELERQVEADLAAGYSVEQILIRRKRNAYNG